MMKTAICITLFLGMLFIAPAFIFAADCGKSPLSEDDMELCGNGFTEDGVVAPTKAKNTLSGDITFPPAVWITRGYEWRKVNITISKESKAKKLYVFQPITLFRIDGTQVPIKSIKNAVWRGVSCKKVKFAKFKLAPGAHELVMLFDPAYDSLLTHTQRGAGQDVNGDGKSEVIYSQDGVNWSTDVGVDLIYELVGKQ